MFRGADAVAIDEKGRFAVPARYRAHLREQCHNQLVVTLHHQAPCLLVYPQPRWLDFEQQLLAKGGLNADVRRLQRHFVGNARELELDKQGRVLLPQLLKQTAGLDGRAVLVGLGQSFELWNETDWKAEFETGRSQIARDGGLKLPAGLEDLPL